MSQQTTPDAARSADATCWPADCEWCQGEGWADRSGAHHLWKAATCEHCGKMGTTEKVQRLNNRDTARARGAMADRCNTSPYERAMRDEWRICLCPPRFLNGGLNTLELLMSPPEPQPDQFGAVHYKREIKPLSDRDYLIAATVIQWLGSNIGRCFLELARNRGDRYAQANVKDDRAAASAAPRQSPCWADSENMKQNQDGSYSKANPL